MPTRAALPYLITVTIHRPTNALMIQLLYLLLLVYLARVVAWEAPQRELLKGTNSHKIKYFVYIIRFLYLFAF